MNSHPKLKSVDVCICTHNPRLELLTVVLTVIANQTLDKEAYQVWIIDNASEPPISDLDLAPLARAGVTYHLLHEPRLGTMYAAVVRKVVLQKYFEHLRQLFEGVSLSLNQKNSPYF
jgi:hypothetical protein